MDTRPARGHDDRYERAGARFPGSALTQRIKGIRALCSRENGEAGMGMLASSAVKERPRGETR